MINLSLLTGYAPQAFEAAVIELLFKKKKNLLDPAELANYGLISSLSFILKALKRFVLN